MAVITLLARAARRSDTDSGAGPGVYAVGPSATLPAGLHQVELQTNIFANSFLDPAQSLRLLVEESRDGGATWRTYSILESVGGSTNRAGVIVGPSLYTEEDFGGRQFRGALTVNPRSDTGGVSTVNCSVTLTTT